MGGQEGRRVRIMGVCCSWTIGLVMDLAEVYEKVETAGNMNEHGTKLNAARDKWMRPALIKAARQILTRFRMQKRNWQGRLVFFLDNQKLGTEVLWAT